MRIHPMAVTLASMLVQQLEPTPLRQGLVVVRWMPVACAEPRDVEAWRALLDDHERARADRFHFRSDRIAFTAAHALARTMLATHGGLPPAAWRFVPGPFGKPAIDPALDRPTIRFNLSHTRGMVACAVTAQDDVGVDIESVDRPNGGRDIADRFFSPAETALIDHAPPDEQRAVFFRLWTLKEAVMKATGRGFNLPLDAFAVTIDPPGVTFHQEPAGPWQFDQRIVAPNHALAVALRSAQPAAFDVRQALAMVA